MKPKPYHSHSLLILIACVGMQILVDPFGAAEEPGQFPPRTGVVILPFENVGGDSEMLSWSQEAAGQLKSVLGHVQAIRIMPGAGYGMRQLDISRGDQIDDKEARRIGELTESRWVIWGSWAKQESEWDLMTRILRTAGEDAAAEITGKGEDWFSVIEQTADRILEELRINSTAAEHRKMSEQPTESWKAYELFIRARYLHREGKPTGTIEPLLREALAIDGEYVDALLGLAIALSTQEKHEEAEKLALQALRQAPDEAYVHMLTATVFLDQEDRQADAEKHLKESIRIDPELASAHNLLGLVYSIQDRWDEAIGAYNKARQLDPFDAGVAARIGAIHIRLGRKEAGFDALQEAERLNDEDLNASVNLGMTFGQLGEFSKAAQHLEKALALGRKRNLDPDTLDSLSERLEFAKGRLKPTFVEATRPQSFSPEELRAELAKLLTPEELAVVVKPVETSPEVKAWVREQTAGADSALDRARLLFEVLARRVRNHGERDLGSRRQETGGWTDPEATFAWREHPGIYVALARELGLVAYQVQLVRDCRGHPVRHGCAALFVGEKALLLDQGYRWFGVPHQEFEILNDLEAVAWHTLQACEDAPGMDRVLAALKLRPDHAMGHLAAAAGYVFEGKFELAEEHLEKADALEPEHPMWYVTRARMAIARDEDRSALQYLQTAHELNPGRPDVKLLLGRTLSELGEHEKALEALRAVLEHDCGCHEELIREAREGIAKISEILALLKGDAAVIDAFEQRAKAGDEQAQNNLAAYYVNRPDPDLPEAMKWLKLAAGQGSATAHFNLGRCHEELDQIDEAFASYRSAVVLDPTLAEAHSRLGSVLFKQDKLEEAIGSCRRALELDPDSAGTHDLLGTALAKQRKFQEAIPSFRRAIALKPEHAPSHIHLGRALLNPGEAIKAFQRAVELDPELAEAHSRLGSALSILGKPEEAIKCHRRALELDPDYAPAHDGLGVELANRGEIDKAITSFERALELDSKLPGAWGNLGVALFKQDRLDEAIKASNRAIELDPDHAGTWSNLGQVLSRQGKLDEAIEALRKATKVDPGLAGAWGALGRALFSLGRHDDAVAALREATKLDDTQAYAWSLLGGVLCSQKKLDEASAAATRAVELNPKDPMARAIIGVALAGNGRMDEAIEAQREAIRLFEALGETETDPVVPGPGQGDPIELDSELAMVWRDLGMNLLKAERLEESIDVFEKLIERDQDDAAAWTGLGVAFVGQDNLDKGVEALLKAKALDPSSSEAWRNLGVAFFKQNKLQEGIEALQEALKLEPEDAKAWGALGTIMCKQGKLDEAVPALRRSVELDDTQAGVLANLAGVLLNQDKPQQAIEAARRAIALDGENATAWGNLAGALFNQGKLDEAIEATNRAIELDDENSTAWGARGAALSNQGRHDEAVRALRKAVSLDAGNAKAREVLWIALSKQGKRGEALDALQKAVDLDPGNLELVRSLVSATARAGEIDRSGVWAARIALTKGERIGRADDESLVTGVRVILRDLDIEIPITPPSENAIREWHESHPTGAGIPLGEVRGKIVAILREEQCTAKIKGWITEARRDLLSERERSSNTKGAATP